MLCSVCDSDLPAVTRFCPECGNRLELETYHVERDGETGEEWVFLQPHQRRVKVASQAPHLRFLTSRHSLDDPMLPRSVVPFDASHIPGSNDLVPGDCAWAILAPPSEFRGDPARGNLVDRLRALGRISGRRYEAIVGYIGAPVNTREYNSGVFRAMWAGPVGALRTHVANLEFDRYGVCLSILGSATI